MEIWSSGGILRVWGRGGVEVWSSGGALQACRRGGVCLKSSGALEVCCRCRDVEEAESYGPGMRRRRVDVESVCLKNSGALGVRCRQARDIDVWSSGGVLQVASLGKPLAFGNESERQFLDRQQLRCPRLERGSFDEGHFAGSK